VECCKKKGEYSEFHVRIAITMRCATHGTPTECEMTKAHCYKHRTPAE